MGLGLKGSDFAAFSKGFKGLLGVLPGLSRTVLICRV